MTTPDEASAFMNRFFTALAGLGPAMEVTEYKTGKTRKTTQGAEWATFIRNNLDSLLLQAVKEALSAQAYAPVSSTSLSQVYFKAAAEAQHSGHDVGLIAVADEAVRLYVENEARKDRIKPRILCASCKVDITDTDGTCFTVCSECWEKKHARNEKKGPLPDDPCNNCTRPRRYHGTRHDTCTSFEET